MVPIASRQGEGRRSLISYNCNRSGGDDQGPSGRGGYPDAGRPREARRSGQAIDPEGDVVEEVLLFGAGPAGDDLPQGFDPLAIGRRQGANGPVATEDD